MNQFSLRGRYIISFILLLTSVLTFGQQKDNVLTWHRNSAFHDYMMREMHGQYEVRRKELEDALKSKEDLGRYVEVRRKSFNKLLGELPSRTPLNAQVSGKIPAKGYHIERIIYESFPGHHVTASLYVPEGKGKFPAVLFFNGHELTAKATESYQQAAILFAKNGFVVLSIDPISQGERIQLTDASGKSLTRGATTEHTLLNAGSMLVGRSVVYYMLWDNMRGLDYLETRAEVDTSRMGCMGSSGGGTQTAYFMAADPRIKVAAPCSYFTERERYVEIAGPQDGCQQLPGESMEHIEMCDLAMLFAPKPLLILAAENDFVDHWGTQQAYKEISNVYQAMGQPGSVSMFTWNDGHGISKPKREAAVTWFKTWLYNDKTLVKEGNILPLSEELLFCTSTGQVNTAFKHEQTVQALSRKCADELARSRKEFLNKPDQEIKQQVIKLLGIDAELARKVTADTIERVSGQKYTTYKIVMYRERGFPVPRLVYTPLSGTKGVALWLQEAGKATVTDSQIANVTGEGHTLVLADLCGMGETLDDPAANESKYWNGEYRNATIGLFTGKPLLGRRVLDVLGLLDIMHADKIPVSIVATGNIYGPVSMHAALLDERIRALDVSCDLKRVATFIDNPLQKEMYSNIYYGMLQYYDLPDLVEKLGSRIKIK